MTHPPTDQIPFARTRSPHVGRCAAALTSIALLLGCGGGTTAPNGGTTPAPPPANKATVDATPSFAFTPSSVTVSAGDTVTFAFGTLAHNVFFDAKTGAPADITGSNANVSVKRAFPTVGTYRYTCHIHPSMVGTIVVQAAGSAAPTPGY